MTTYKHGLKTGYYWIKNNKWINDDNITENDKLYFEITKVTKCYINWNVYNDYNSLINSNPLLNSRARIMVKRDDDGNIIDYGFRYIFKNE